MVRGRCSTAAEQHALKLCQIVPAVSVLVGVQRGAAAHRLRRDSRAVLVLVLVVWRGHSPSCMDDGLPAIDGWNSRVLLVVRRMSHSTTWLNLMMSGLPAAD
jgi:hypothetical protein